MALLIPPGYGLASWEFSSDIGTQPFATTCGVLRQDDSESWTDIADLLMTQYGDSLLPVTTDELTLDRVTIRLPGPGGTTGSVESTLAPLPGEDTGAQSPVAMALIARKITAVPGRAGRGRMFLPGTAAESEVDINGAVTDAQRTNVANRVSEMWGNIAQAAGDVIPVLLHDEESPVSEPSTIQSWSISPLVGWIRKRVR